MRLLIRKINKCYHKLKVSRSKIYLISKQAPKALYSHPQKSPYFVWAYLFFTFLLSMQAVSQNSLNDIDLLKIPQKKIKQVILYQLEHDVVQFSDLRSTFIEDVDTLEFHEQRKTFLIEEGSSVVWENYKRINPAKSWEGKMVSFGVLLSKYDSSIMYREDSYSGIEVGQVFYLNLRLFKGIYNLPVVFEIISVDEINKVIEISYVEGGKTRGRQKLKFIETTDGNTEIIHSTLFKSDSWLRDKLFYPHFHNKIIKEFHKNILKEIMENNILPQYVHE